MFQHVAVDGSSSRVPGELIEEEDGRDNLGDDTVRDSPMSQCATSPRKRRGSQCASSPTKKTKSPMVKVMKKISESLQAKNEITKSAIRGDHRAQAIKEYMQLVVECGAKEGSAEHFMATQLLVNAENRDMFLTFTANEGRLSWLKRWCEKENLY
ncbi:hypothetical protein BS78_K057800 [Paspalum vaginatum]|uniref:Uncharacterized protein n=1 Tax=Paspalum vaginatum TaxID=158149 RepID=A0A9W8CFD1_9POAL|nr:hypothetical protein BS78_K057800 [Paspalum vaginatum]